MTSWSYFQPSWRIAGSSGRRSNAEDLAVSALLWDLLDANADRYDTQVDATYAIQGGAEAFTTRLSGSYSGVMGLPLHETAGLLRQFGAIA